MSTTLTEDDIEVGAYIETVTEMAISDDVEKAGIVTDIVEKTKHTGVNSTMELTLVVLTNGDDEWEIAIENLTEESADNITVTEFRAAPDEEEDDEDEPEIVTDGGRDVSEHLTDRDLEVAIENRGAPVTVEELRDIVAAAQRDIEEWWPEHMDTFEEGHMTLVHEDDDVVVFSDPTSHFWSEQLDALEVEDPETRGAFITAQHNAANRIADWNWSASYPVVIAKPSDFGAGQDFDHRHLMWLMGECGLSGGVALDYLMVEWHGMSQNDWARRAGKDQGTVSQNIKKANDKAIR